MFYNQIYSPISGLFQVGFTGVKYAVKAKPNDNLDLNVAGQQEKKLQTSVSWSQQIKPFFKNLKTKISGRFTGDSTASTTAEFGDVNSGFWAMMTAAFSPEKKFTYEGKSNMKYREFGFVKEVTTTNGMDYDGKASVCFSKKGFAAGMAANFKSSPLNMLLEHSAPSVALGFADDKRRVATEFGIGKKKFLKFGYLQNLNATDKLAVQWSQDWKDSEETSPMMALALSKKLATGDNLTVKVDNKYDLSLLYKTKINANLTADLSMQANLCDIQPKTGLSLNGNF